jgi:hypothetical protein
MDIPPPELKKWPLGLFVPTAASVNRFVPEDWRRLSAGYLRLALEID